MLKAVAVILMLACSLLASTASPMEAPTPEQAREIAKEAYIYGFPLVDNYRINYSYFLDVHSPEFKASWNRINNTARVYTPYDKAIQTPNSDTPYSQLGMDLRAEPLVLTVPRVAKGRYFSIQLIDQYTFNFAYIGSRATGDQGGRFMVVGPNWVGKKPAGVSAIFRSGSDFAWALYRTQLFDPADIENVKAIQAGYKVEPLSAFLGKPAPPPSPTIKYIPPLTVEAQRNSLDFFNVLNFILQFCPADPSERALRERFARIGVAPGKTFNPTAMPAPVLQAIKQGMADAWAEFDAFKEKNINTLKVTSGDLFGTRAYLKNNYLYRMAGAVLGIYGNSKHEAMYPVYLVDANGANLNGKSNSYTLHFRACLGIRFERDSCFALDVIHTLDVDTPATGPDGQDHRKDQALSL